jgi:hypothetical protein
LKKGGLLVRNTIFTKQKHTYKRGVSFIPQLNYLGDDGSIFHKLPLQQLAEWTDDFECIADICDDFVVNGVDVFYPGTTTTTTVVPYDAILYFNAGPLAYTTVPDGHQAQILYTYDFVDPILPGYSVDLSLDYEIDLITNVLIQTYVFTFAQIIVQINGGAPIEQIIETNTSNTTRTINGTIPVTINSGDIVTITVVNIAQSGSYMPPAPGENVTSATVLTTVVNSVSPGGEISIVLPSPSQSNVANSS